MFRFFVKAIIVRFSPEKDLFKAIHNYFGFYPRNIDLYKLAFLHKSQSQDIHNGLRLNNERLEYLGDAILSAIVADYLYKKFPFKGEGFLTEVRSRIVCRNNLNKLSEEIGLDKYILAGKDCNLKARSMKGDTFEAFIGAVYLDKGYKFAKKVVVSRIIPDFVNIEELVNTDSNYKSRIIEYAQREKKNIEFVIADTLGSGYRRQYVVNVVIDGVVEGSGQDFSVKGAEQNAACNAINLINGNVNKND